MKKWVSLVVISAFLILPGFSQAGEKEKGRESVTMMEEVVVTASRVKEKKKEITTNVTIIDEEAIKASSARDLGDLLAEKGIGHIQKYPGALTSIGIRGFRTETHGNDLMGHVLILLNGRRAGTGNLAKIMTKNIERIEIIRGPASVQYGSAAMGGVVNVITKQGKDKPTAFVEGILGSWGHEEESVGLSGKVKGLDFSGSFTTQSMDDYDTADGDRYRNTGYDRQENTSINIGYEFLQGNRIGAIYTNFDADNVGCPDYLSSNDLDDNKDTSNESIDLIYDGRTPGGLFSWMVRYFDGEDKDNYFYPAGSQASDAGYPYSKGKTDNKGTQAQVSFNREYLLLTAGFDWANYENDFDDIYGITKTEYDNPAGFILAKARLFDERLIITGGLRYDDYEVEEKKPERRKEDDHNISPRFGIAYLLTDCLKLRANYGQAFRMPSADELFVGGWAILNGQWVQVLPNPDLDPEESDTYEGGIDFSYASFNASLTYFYTNFDDKIQGVPVGAYTGKYENTGEATMQGIEGEFSYDMGTLFSWDFEVKPYVNFVYLTQYEDDETDRDLKYTDKYHVSYGITVSDLEGFSANLNFAYTGKKKIDDWQNSDLMGIPPEIEEGGFTVANLTVSKRIFDFNEYGGITLRGEVQNLFDKDYEYAKGYTMPGRSFFLGLRYDF